MSVGARIFVGIIFTIIGLSFVATTASLYYEFGYKNPGTNWIDIATFYSHLFIFFPVFGLLALAAFYIPSCAFTDMYWNHVPYGKFRFGLGFVVLLAFAAYGGMALGEGKVRSIWEAKPSVLLADQGEGCGPNQTCTRAPVLQALSDVREQSRLRTGMAAFVLKCKDDPLIQMPERELVKRYCFATGALADDKTCCLAQDRFGIAMGELAEPEASRSLTDKVHRATLPLKLFFLLVVLSVGVLLAVRRKGIQQHYANWIPKIERGVLVGAFTMLFLPIMNLAFLQSNALLYGNNLDSLYRTISWPGTIVFVGWALILMFFFLRDIDKDWETVGRIAGVVGSMLAVSNYNLIIDYFVRFVGSGADNYSLSFLGIAALAALVAIIIQPKGKRVRDATT